MQTLIESISPSTANVICESSNVVTESNGNNSTMWLNGIFMQADVQNRNERIYPVSEMTSAVTEATKVIKENGGIFGELDHPQTLTINMDRISHAITELYMNGTNVIGKAKLLKTPMGLIAEELARSGVRFGISSRGSGQVNESDKRVSSYTFVTADLVATPSAPAAFPKPVYETLYNSKEGERVAYLAEKVKEDKDAQKYFKKEINNFVKNIFNNSTKNK